MSKEKIRNALDRYYKAFDYDDGTLAYKRGGQMGFGKKFYLGGDEDEVSDEDLDIGENGSKSWKDIFDFSNTNWGGLAGTAVGLIGDTVGGFRDMADRSTQLEKSVNQYGTGAFNNVYDNTSLLSAISNTPGLTNISKSDIRNKTVGQDIGSAFSTGLSAGLSTGNVFVGIGAGLLDAGKSIAQRLKARSYADRINQYIKDKNIRLNKQAFMASQGVDAHNDWMRMMGYYMNPYDYALGGEMRTHGADFNNGLTFINEGGTHEQNPYEGVPSGVDDEGTPNLVEEGEVIWNNEYVFSNRIKIPKHLAKKYKLGGNLTFADAIKEVTKESLTRPNDPISNETNKAIVNEFMDEQEALREKEQQNAARQLQTAYDEDFMSQLDAISTPQEEAPTDMSEIQLPQQNFSTAPLEGMPVGYAVGGPKRNVRRVLKKQAEKLLEDSGVMSKKEARQQKLRRLQSQLEEIFGPPSIQELTNLLERTDSTATNDSATSELLFPNIFDKGTVPSKKNTFDKGSKKNSGYKPGLTGTLVEGLEDVYDTGNGVYYDGKTGSYYTDIDTIRYLRGLPPISMDDEIVASVVTDSRTEKKPEGAEVKADVSGGNGAAKRTFKSNIKFVPKGAASIRSLNATDKDDIVPYKYRPTWQRKIPVYGAGAMALYGMVNRPDYANADAIIEAARLAGAPVNIPVQTIGDYMTYKPFDERYLVNMANQNRAAAARGITNTAGGNRAMDLLGNMSLAHSNQQELGEIARQAYLANQQQRSAVAEFNRGTNVQNMSAINQRNLSQAQLNSQRQATALSGLDRGHSLRQSIRDTWDAATMQSLNSMLASIGAIGKENEEYNMMTSMAEHGYFPHFYGDKGILQLAPNAQQQQLMPNPFVLWQPDIKWKPNYQWKIEAKGGIKKNKKRRF